MLGPYGCRLLTDLLDRAGSMARLALLLVASLFLTLSFAASFDGLVNKEVKREVDLTSQLTVQSSTITVENVGSKEATTYYISTYEEVASHVADVSATDASGAKLTVGAAEKGSGYVLSHARKHFRSSLPLAHRPPDTRSSP